jgi:hypothetical protein
MKTTLDISEALLEDARKLAAREGTTLRAVVERGLRSVLKESEVAGSLTLRDGSVGGNGLRPELANLGWDEIRRLSYGDRGS